MSRSPSFGVKAALMLGVGLAGISAKLIEPLLPKSQSSAHVLA